MSPDEIVVREAGRILRIVFDSETIELDAEYLRVESPSAEVQGHNPSQKVIVAGKRDVRITGAEPVGNYAIRLTFSDGHNSGIYPWAGLRRMADERAVVWDKYLKKLEEKGLRRDI